MQIEVLDPVLCVASGGGGPQVNPVRLRIAADLRRVKENGRQVPRYRLGQNSAAFALPWATAVAPGADRFVVPDTAPTRHSLLFLDATEAYRRKIARKATVLPDEVREFLPRFRDPAWSQVRILTVRQDRGRSRWAE